MAFGIGGTYYVEPELSVIDRLTGKATPQFIERLSKMIGKALREKKAPPFPVTPFNNHNHYLVAVRECIGHETCIEKIYVACYLFCVDHQKIGSNFLLKNTLTKYL